MKKYYWAFFEWSNNKIPPFLRGDFFMCARQGADTWEWKSPMSPVRGIISGRQGCPPWGGICRKPKAKHWPDEQKPHKRQLCWIMGHKSQKSDTYPESIIVNVAGISVKVLAHYPGRSLILPLVLSLSWGDEMGSEKSAEVILVRRLADEGPNFN